MEQKNIREHILPKPPRSIASSGKWDVNKIISFLWQGQVHCFSAGFHSAMGEEVNFFRWITKRLPSTSIYFPSFYCRRLQCWPFFSWNWGLLGGCLGKSQIQGNWNSMDILSFKQTKNHSYSTMWPCAISRYPPWNERQICPWKCLSGWFRWNAISFWGPRAICRGEPSASFREDLLPFWNRCLWKNF